jgi:hypothetical protein
LAHPHAQRNVSIGAMCIGNEAVRHGENPWWRADISSGVSFD